MFEIIFLVISCVGMVLLSAFLYAIYVEAQKTISRAVADFNQSIGEKLSFPNMFPNFSRVGKLPSSIRYRINQLKHRVNN